MDAKRIGITGASYGDFMTMMAIRRTPDVFAAGSEPFGMSNCYTLLQHSEPLHQEYEKSLLGDPVKDRAVYERSSPITYIAHAKAPLLVLQTDNDICAPKDEAEQVVALIRQHGGIVEANY